MCALFLEVFIIVPVISGTLDDWAINKKDHLVSV